MSTKRWSRSCFEKSGSGNWKTFQNRAKRSRTNQTLRQMRLDEEAFDHSDLPRQEGCVSRGHRSIYAAVGRPIHGYLKKMIGRPWDDVTRGWHARIGHHPTKRAELAGLLEQIEDDLREDGVYDARDGRWFFLDENNCLALEVDEPLPGTGRRSLGEKGESTSALRQWVKKRRVIEGLDGRLWWACEEVRTQYLDDLVLTRVYLVALKILNHEECVYYDTLSARARHALGPDWTEQIDYESF